MIASVNLSYWPRCDDLSGFEICNLRIFFGFNFCGDFFGVKDFGEDLLWGWQKAYPFYAERKETFGELRSRSLDFSGSGFSLIGLFLGQIRIIPTFPSLLGL